MGPYRTPQRAAAAPTAGRTRCPDGDLVWLFLMLWLVSIGRVGVGAAHRETFGPAATLAVLFALVGPWLLWPAAAWALRQLAARWRAARDETPGSAPHR